MRIGVTGTRKGMNEFQQARMYSWLAAKYVISVDEVRYLHHGDCVGVDAEVAAIAKQIGYEIIGHPPRNIKHRAFFLNDKTLPTRPYLKRNQDIVDQCDLMFVVFDSHTFKPRSGTWSTYGKAIKARKDIVVFYPDLVKVKPAED